jgi:hypothetical protein
VSLVPLLLHALHEFALSLLLPFSALAPPTFDVNGGAAGKMTEKVGEMFKEDGSVGRQFTPEGAAGADPYDNLLITPPT